MPDSGFSELIANPVLIKAVENHSEQWLAITQTLMWTLS